jgi:flagellar biosynthesis regulator FlaF
MYERMIVSLSFSSKVWSLFISRLTQVANFIEFQIFCSLALIALDIHLTRSIQIRIKNVSAKIMFRENQNMLILRKNQRNIKIT